MIVPPIPDRLEKAILFLRGEREGRVWLDALPARIAQYAWEWELTLDSVADSGAMSCCVYCSTADGAAAVLKIPVDEESGRTEQRLLERWAFAGAGPEVLHRAGDSGVFLMSRILPGTIAWAVGGADDSAHFGALLSRLNRDTLAEAPPLKGLTEVVHMRMDWARERFDDPRYAVAIARFTLVATLDDAAEVIETLLRTTTVQHVLHADLQAKNILHGAQRWYTIDPLGAVGDINAEAALWVAIQDGPGTIAERLTELGHHELLTSARLRAWTYVFAIIEYRPYLPPSATRIENFLTVVSRAEVLDGLVAP